MTDEPSPISPNSRGTPTSLDIQAAWEAAEKPSQRSVEKIMRAQGWSVSASSIIRCVNSGFAPRSHIHSGRTNEQRTVKTSPEINAVRQVQSIAPENAPPAVLAEALVEAIRNLPSGEQNRVKELLEMSDQAIIDSTRKLYLVGGHLLAEDLAKHTKLAMLAPEKFAKLWQALGSSMPLAAPPPATDAKVIDHSAADARPLSPSAQAIRDFRAKRGSAAA